MDTNNLLEKDWALPCTDTRVSRKDGSLFLQNDSDKAESVPLKRKFSPHGKFGDVVFEGEALKGNAPVFMQCGEDESDPYTAAGKASLNSRSVFSYRDDCVLDTTILILAPHSEARIDRLTVVFFDDEGSHDGFLLEDLSSDILVITPDYPAPENRYLCGFVHSRMHSYAKSGLSFDVVCTQVVHGACKYTHENIDVLRTSYVNVRTILRKKSYAKILVHFFDPRIALVFDSCDLHGAELYFWCHNPETRYWESPKYAAPYFEQPAELTQEQVQEYRKKDEVIKRYNENPAVNWIFISEAQKDHSEADIGIAFNRAHIIPNVVDEAMFPFSRKDPELRKRVFMLRRFDNLSSYSIDTCVRAIVELSRRPCFTDMEFDLYGTGEFYQELVEPLLGFENVHLHPYFLSHTEIAQAHKSSGIALFPTRYDSQGVSAGEAAMSGMAVVSSKIDAAQYFLPSDKGLLADPENYLEYADILERLYQDPAYFEECCHACHDKILARCGTDKTTGLELELISRAADTELSRIEKRPQDKQVLLSVVIPSYNAADYLSHGVATLMGQPHANLLEILIINDGSRDTTAEVARHLMNTYNDPAAPIIKLIDKQNGGHGSTINTGLSVAAGKYFKIVDADDWLESNQFQLLLELLEKETSDIVVVDYSEDRAIPSETVPQHLYDFMTPGLQYRFDDVCRGSYGFSEFGPIIATSCFRTEMLKETGFALSEHCFYVDMELDMYSVLRAETITYYPLDVYRYFIGRDGQSISRASFIKNQKDHQKIIEGLLTYLHDHPEISAAKRSYITNNLIAPVTKTHYMIVSEWCRNAAGFRGFDRVIARWPEVYNHPDVATMFVRFHRKTRGMLLGLNPVFLRINELMKYIRKV